MLPAEFLDPKNDAGRSLLKLVSRGNAIIAEMRRLSENIPKVFTGEDDVEATKYAPIIFDFSFFKNSEVYERKIESSEELLDLDDEFRENHEDMLLRFYKMFESIVRYAKECNEYIGKIREGVFMQHTLENMMADDDARQLLTEVVFIYGVQLLIMDQCLPGKVREKIVVAFHRHKTAGVGNTIRDVVKLVRSTGFSREVRPKEYPEKFFARFSMDQELVEMIVGRLRNSDIYNQSKAYPSPRHRSTMLATQASMLYVILYFAPNILHNKNAIMREIVDKHFSDNWVISYYMGNVVDLNAWWEPYKAAKQALKNTMEKSNVIEIMKEHAAKMPNLLSNLKEYLTDGVLIEDYVMDNIQKLMNSLRDFNGTLRWLMLHRYTVNPKIRETIVELVKKEKILYFIMKVSQFEFQIKRTLSEVLRLKASRWAEYKKEAFERMVELSEYFSGEKPLTRNAKDENLQKWFKMLSEIVNELEYDLSPTVAGRKIMHLMHALQEVEEFHQVESSLQIKQFLAETREYLTKMVRVVNVHQDIIGQVGIISDFSYAWEMLRDYVALMQNEIKKNPSVVLLLRATFLKLVSIIDAPLERISQCESKDLVSVSAYYSEQIVNFVREVLAIVPKTVFDMLNDIVQLEANTLKPLPMKLERKLLKQFSQLDARYKLARTTHRVSVFTEGILNMKVTLLGVVEVEPTQLLEEGIRKELVFRIAEALHTVMQFQAPKKSKKKRRNEPANNIQLFENRLGDITKQLSAFQRSFEYIQDYIKVYGLRMWQEEFGRIINYSVEQESNRFLRKKVYDWQSDYQSDAIRIPRFKPVPGTQAVNFMGRIANEILKQTDLKQTIYVHQRQAWLDNTGKEVVGLHTMQLMFNGLGAVGLKGLDRLVAFMMVSDMQKLMKWYRRHIGDHVLAFLTSVKKQLDPVDGIAPKPKKLYPDAYNKLVKVFQMFQQIVLPVGHKQLMRNMIANTLNFFARLDSKILTCSLEVLNRSLLNDIKAHYRQPEQNPHPKDDNPLLGDLTNFLDSIGLSHPLEKIYITTEPLAGVAMMNFLFVLFCLEKMKWDPQLNTLIRINSKENLEGAALAVGILTVFKQFHPDHLISFIRLMCQYIRSCTDGYIDSKSPEFPLCARNAMHFLEMLVLFSGGSITRSLIQKYLPNYLLDNFPQ